MSLKTIFAEGMKERRRRKSLGKQGGEFRIKEKAFAERLTALGQKAWETNAVPPRAEGADISAFSDLQAALAAVQKTLDELRAQEEQLQKQKQGTEERKKEENDRLAAAQKEAEEKKKDVDKRLGEQKRALQTGLKEMQNSRDRLAAIARERSQLQSRSAVPETGEAEKVEIAKGLDLLDKEAAALQTSINAHEAAGKPVEALVSQLQEGSNQMKKRLDDLRQEQKQVISEQDKKIAALKSELAKNSEQAREADGKRQLSFLSLGEKLADAGSVDPGLSGEMAAVSAARNEKDGVQAMIGGLERQKDEGQVNAYKKMLAILIGGIVLLAALAVVLVLLLSPRKTTPAIAGLEPDQAKALQQIMKMAEKAQQGIGKQAEQGRASAAVSETGRAIVDEMLAAFDQCVAEAATLAATRPEASVLLPQLEKLYAGYGEKMAALNARFLALRDRDIFAFRQANGYMSQNRPRHVFAKDNALSQAVAYYNYEKGEQEIVDMLSMRIVKLLDQAVQQ